jgi:hypothetical protein
MKRSRKCPKCESNKIIEEARVVDRPHHSHLSLEVDERPDAILFKRAPSTKLSAWVCSAFGFVRLYAQDPEELG